MQRCSLDRRPLKLTCHSDGDRKRDDVAFAVSFLSRNIVAPTRDMQKLGRFEVINTGIC